MEYLLVKFSLKLFSSLPLHKDKELMELLDEKKKFELFLFFLYHGYYIPYKEIPLVNYYDWKNIEKYIFDYSFFYKDLYTKINMFLNLLNVNEILTYQEKIEDGIVNNNIKRIKLPKELSFIKKIKKLKKITFYDIDLLREGIINYFLYSRSLNLDKDEKLFVMTNISKIDKRIDFNNIKNKNIRLFLAWLFINKNIRYKLINSDIYSAIDIIENMDKIDNKNIRSFWIFISYVNNKEITNYYYKDSEKLKEIVEKYELYKYYKLFKALPGIKFLVKMILNKN